MSGLESSQSTAFALLVAAADLIVVTLPVAWALEEVVYFSLFVGIPVGIASAVASFVLVRRLLENGRTPDGSAEHLLHPEALPVLLEPDRQVQVEGLLVLGEHADVDGVHSLLEYPLHAIRKQEPA